MFLCTAVLAADATNGWKTHIRQPGVYRVDAATCRQLLGTETPVSLYAQGRAVHLHKLGDGFLFYGHPGLDLFGRYRRFSDTGVYMLRPGPCSTMHTATRDGQGESVITSIILEKLYEQDVFYNKDLPSEDVEKDRYMWEAMISGDTLSFSDTLFKQENLRIDRAGLHLPPETKVTGYRHFPVQAAPRFYLRFTVPSLGGVFYINIAGKDQGNATNILGVKYSDSDHMLNFQYRNPAEITDSYKKFFATDVQLEAGKTYALRCQLEHGSGTFWLLDAQDEVLYKKRVPIKEFLPTISIYNKSNRELVVSSVSVTSAAYKQKLLHQTFAPDVSLPIVKEGQARLTLGLWGISPDDHIVDVRVNGHAAGRVTWQKAGEKIADLQLPAAHLADKNVFTLSVPEGEGDTPRIDRVNVDFFLLQAPCRPEWRGEPFAFSLADTYSNQRCCLRVRAAGEKLFLWDISNHATIPGRRLAGGTREFRFFAKENAKYYLFAEEHIRDLCAKNWQLTGAPDLGQAGNADMVVISEKTFRKAAADYGLLRNRQDGLCVYFCDVADIYDTYSHGYPHFQAIRDYLRQLAASDPRPDYILLLGDAFVDFRNNSASFGRTIVPTCLCYGRNGEYPSDTAYGIWDHTLHFPVARIPVQTPAELRCYTEKVALHRDYESDRVLLISGGKTKNLQSSFQKKIEQLANTYLKPNLLLPVLLYENFMKGAEEIAQAINTGVSTIFFFGHGGLRYWGYGVFRLADIPLLDNPGRNPIAFAFTCYTAYFSSAREKSFARELLLLPDKKGFIAYYSATDISAVYINNLLADHLCEEMYVKRTKTIGQVVANATRRLLEKQIATTDYHARMYNLLGDPSLAMRILPDAPASLKTFTVPASMAGRPVDVLLRLVYGPPTDTAEEMALTYRLIDGKGHVLINKQQPLTREDNEITLSIQAPEAPGDYRFTVNITQKRKSILREEKKLSVLYPAPRILAPADKAHIRAFSELRIASECLDQPCLLIVQDMEQEKTYSFPAREIVHVAHSPLAEGQAKHLRIRLKCRNALSGWSAPVRFTVDPTGRQSLVRVFSAFTGYDGLELAEVAPNNQGSLLLHIEPKGVVQQDEIATIATADLVNESDYPPEHLFDGSGDTYTLFKYGATPELKLDMKAPTFCRGCCFVNFWQVEDTIDSVGIYGAKTVRILGPGSQEPIATTTLDMVYEATEQCLTFNTLTPVSQLVLQFPDSYPFGVGLADIRLLKGRYVPKGQVVMTIPGDVSATAFYLEADCGRNAPISLRAEYITPQRRFSVILKGLETGYYPLAQYDNTTGITLTFMLESTDGTRSPCIHRLGWR